MVLDASAVLALLNGESGADEIRSIVLDASVSAVNVAEVVGKLTDAGIPERDIRQILAIGLRILPFGEEEISHIPAVRKSSRKVGLSLGDRCCLATALACKEPVVTADRAWVKVKIPGLKITVLKDRQ